MPPRQRSISIPPTSNWPNFEYWVQRYKEASNPVFVPEARLETAPVNALYAYGEVAAFGFAPFGIDSLEMPAGSRAPTPMIEQTYAALTDLSEMLLPAQAAGKTRGLVLHADSPRPTQTIALGGYLMEATLSRSWPAKALIVEDGAMLVVQSAADEFYTAGRELTVSFMRDPDVDERIAGIASVEEVSRSTDGWQTEHRLNGDQSNQGRQLSLAATQVRVYRVRLYAATRERDAAR